MAWINLKPENPGGGRKRQPPAAKLSTSGQLVLNHEASDLVGEYQVVKITGGVELRKKSTPEFE